MNELIAQLCENRVFYYFYQISQIPHGSGNERALSDFIVEWAKRLNLEVEQDSCNNVFIRKPAAIGYEKASGIMLQAHLDMVCEKAKGVEHDFKKDPIRWYIEDDILSTGGKTTLGADNGIGMALAMAILEDKELKHPPLEVLFTVNEEDDLSGATNFDTSKMRSNYLINLDNGNDTEILCGSCGGMRVDIHIPVISGEVPEGWNSYRLSVSGLKGGHSGEDIHRGRDNANVLLNRMLMVVEECCDFRLGMIRGGSFRLAISRDAEAVVWFDPSHVDMVREKLAEMEAMVRAELLETSGDVVVNLEPVQAPDWGIVPEPVLDAIALCPDGIYQMNEMISGLVDSSDNLGEIYLNEQELHFIIEIRSARDSRRTYLYQRMQRLARLLGGTCSFSNAYSSWEFHPESKLRELCENIYKKSYGKQPAFQVIHAGLEVGCFFATKSDLDAVSIGPNCWNLHSPREAVSISSTKKIYEYLCNVLAAIY